MIKVFHCHMTIADDFEPILEKRHDCYTHPFGDVTVAIDMDTKSVGATVVHPDDHFQRKVGWQKATGRCKQGLSYSGPISLTRHGFIYPVKKMVLDFLNRTLQLELS